MSKSNRGRPAAVAPNHYLTLAEAAAQAEVSYSTVYRHANSGLLKTRKEGASIFVLASDLKKIAEATEDAADRASQSADGRRAVFLRPSQERYDRWQQQAAKHPSGRVSTWLAELADAEAGIS